MVHMIRFTALLLLVCISKELTARKMTDWRMNDAIIDSLTPDTGDVQTGTIIVRKKPIRPYVKVDYSLMLACVKDINQPMYDDSTGQGQWVNQPLIDTACIPKSLTRVLPQKKLQIGRTFAQSLKYEYSSADSARTDTLYIGFWIDTKGGIRGAYADDRENTTMPDELYNQLVVIAKTFLLWGDKGGGYITKRKFLRKGDFRRQDYYCIARVIVSSKPLTPEQVIAGQSSIPVMDYPYGGATGLEMR